MRRHPLHTAAIRADVVSRHEDLPLPIQLDRPHQAALDLYGFYIRSATRYFDDTIVIAGAPTEAFNCFLVLSDTAEVWAAELNAFIHRNDQR